MGIANENGVNRSSVITFNDTCGNVVSNKKLPYHRGEVMNICFY